MPAYTWSTMIGDHMYAASAATGVDVHSSRARAHGVSRAFTSIPRMTRIWVEENTHMARIVNADKSEVLRSITIDEYGNKATFSSRNGSGTLSVTVKDPKRAERESLRTFIENLVSETPTLDIIAELDKRDEDATQKWGERLPNDFSISFWLEPNVMATIANVYDDSDLSTDARVTIREALSGDTANTKGF